MFSSFFTEADGRLHRARQPIRKLVALGLSENDVLDLFRRFKDRPRGAPDQESRSHDSSDRDLRLRLAQKAIRTLIALGFPECDIANLADVHPATITHMLDPFESRVVGHDTVQKLQDAVRRAGAERLNALLPRVRVNVLDTCCDKGLSVNKVAGEALEEGVRGVLRNVLLRSGRPGTLAPGVTGVLAELGDPSDGVTVMVAPFRDADTPEQRLARAKALEHEAAHLLQRYRHARQRLEKQERPARRSAVPKDGPIA